MTHECKQEKIIGGVEARLENIEMSVKTSADSINKLSDGVREVQGDVKLLLAEHTTANSSITRFKFKFDKHEEESQNYREMVAEHEILLKDIKEKKAEYIQTSQWRIGLIVGIICGLPSATLALILIFR